jgi:hypothetical protein
VNGVRLVQALTDLWRAAGALTRPDGRVLVKVPGDEEPWTVALVQTRGQDVVLHLERPS